MTPAKSSPQCCSSALTAGALLNRCLTLDLKLIFRLLLSLLFWICASSYAAQPAWPNAPYSHYSDRAPLPSVLAEFAKSFSLFLNVSPAVQGTVNGKFTASSPTEYINKLAGVYGFVWFTYAGVLHVSKSSDTTIRTFALPEGSLAYMRKALFDLGVLDSRFGWGELPTQSAVVVSGPPAYVKLIESTLQGIPVAAGRQLAVFRLKYASAEDRTIRYRDREIKTSGLATILRNMVSTGSGSLGSEPAPASAPATPALGVVQPRPDNQSSLRPDGGERGRNPAPEQRAATQRAYMPIIQSDPRLNAIIVQDVIERIPVYRKLIEELDVPSALIEIEAMILDVNSDRAKDLGINWGGRDGRVAAGFGNLQAIPPAGTLTVVRGASGVSINPSTLIADAGNYLVSQIRLLESKGEASIQSRPSVLTVDNVGALLDLSETFYVRVQGERVATVTPVTAGTTLNVTPRVIEQGGQQLVQLIVDIEDGQIQDRQIDTLPTVRRSTVSTQAIIKPGDTLLIAGHSQNQSLKSNNKLPIIGDIPGIGLLFSNQSSSQQRRERFFMIKPRIVSTPSLNSDILAAAPTALPPIPATTRPDLQPPPATGNLSAVVNPPPAAAQIAAPARAPEPTALPPSKLTAVPEKTTDQAPAVIVAASTKAAEIVTLSESTTGNEPKKQASGDAPAQPPAPATIADNVTPPVVIPSAPQFAVAMAATAPPPPNTVSTLPSYSSPPSAQLKNTPPSRAGRYFVQVAAIADAGNVKNIQQQISNAGFPTYTESTVTAKGILTRVRAGPFMTRMQAEEAVRRLTSSGLDAVIGNR